MDLLSRLKDYTTRLRNYVNSQDSRTFVLWSFLLYFVFVAITIACHEMWRDEMQSWLIAKGSHSLPELFHNLRYDGHPVLWYIPLYLVSKITSHPAAMQLVHLIIAGGAAYLFLKFSPFTRLQKLLFVFGYFPAYEYAVISRNYAIGILLIFLFCTLFRPRANKNCIILSIILFLLAQTSAYGFIAALLLFMLMTLGFLVSRNQYTNLPINKWKIIFCICLVLVGLYISATTMVPDSYSTFAGLWTNNFDSHHFPETLRTVWQGFVPMPRFDKHCYWNTNVLRGRKLMYFLSLFLLCFVSLMFARKPLILFLFSFGAAAMLTFKYFIYPGYMRHHGFLFILFITCLWLEKYYLNEIKLKPPLLLYATAFCNKYKNFSLNVLLSIHLITGLFASGMDWEVPFSTGKAVAQYIKDNKMEDMLILGDKDAPTSTVAGYLNRPIYYLRGARLGSFIIFDKNRLVYIPELRLFEKTARLAQKNKSDVLLVLNYKLKTDCDSISKLEEFDKSIVADENFYLYLYKCSAKEGGN